jgi:N,N-dimethylformamidase
VLIGYVSDENYVALSGVELEFENESGSVEARSRISGAVYAELEPGVYQVALGKAGYGSKRVEITVAKGRPFQFRLLSEQMYGFMWPKWVRAGETSEYCVNSTEQFRLDLWRYGWEKEFIRSMGWCDEHGPKAMMQLFPDEDFTQTGVQWNRIGYTLEYQKHGLETPQQSGLYFLHATTRSGRFCSFPWIVSPDQPKAPVALLASTITWNAYNKFGGRSNYFNQDGLPERPIVNSRQDLSRYTHPDSWPFKETAVPLSFQRPEPASQIPEHAKITDPISGRTESCFAPGLWRLTGWMDREEFQYDLYSDVELHFGSFPLDDYKVLLLDHHPEYWSKEMYVRVKEWTQNRGGKLMYLGGCGLYAEVDFDDESTMCCRREGVFDMRGGETPDHLLGVAYTHTGFQTGAPYRVLDDSHWVFADTKLRNGDLFGHRSLHERCPGGASAHELDKIGPNSPPNLVHLAKGDAQDGNGSDMIIFETPSGGAVFSTGSLTWTLSLPIDDQVSAITANVLRRFLE